MQSIGRTFRRFDPNDPYWSNGLQFYADLWNVNQQGYLLSFDGNDKLAAIVANFRSADSSGTYELTGFRSSSTDNDQTLFASSDIGTTTSYIQGFVASATGRVTITVRNAGGAVNTVSGTLNVCDSIRHTIHIKSNGTTWSILIDGMVDTPIVVTNNNTGDWFADVTLRDNLSHGAIVKTTSIMWAICEMGQHRFYSRELSDAECLVNHQRGWKSTPSDTTGLVYNLPCTEGTGNPVDTVGAITMVATGATWVEGLTDRSPNALALTSFGSPTWGITGRDFNGTSQYINVNGTVTGIKAVMGWIYPDDNTIRSIMDFDAGTHSIEMDGNGDLTATGWGTPSFYVDGVSATAITQSAWNCFMVTSATAFNGTAIVLGKEASYFDGKQGEFPFYNRVPTLSEFIQFRNTTKWRYGL